MPVKYRLKGENFTIVSGPDAGKKFMRGRVYEQVPDGYQERFEKIPETDKPPAPAVPRMPKKKPVAPVPGPGTLDAGNKLSAISPQLSEKKLTNEE